jgi:hypothetical protein
MHRASSREVLVAMFMPIRMPDYAREHSARASQAFRKELDTIASSRAIARRQLPREEQPSREDSHRQTPAVISAARAMGWDGRLHCAMEAASPATFVPAWRTRGLVTHAYSY